MATFKSVSRVKGRPAPTMVYVPAAKTLVTFKKDANGDLLCEVPDKDTVVIKRLTELGYIRVNTKVSK